ncbi:hypothetical protein DNTS_018931 [Danionella cerebrum]|uniref:Uncharacterized protein n=1 Tax=Danionella cerebrum TaxID=2873325 RepID=A0A553QKB7_9TELE|nr:hypothetical protein DNTS_018931 [Danionella translucida]
MNWMVYIFSTPPTFTATSLVLISSPPLAFCEPAIMPSLPRLELDEEGEEDVSSPSLEACWLGSWWLIPCSDPREGGDISLTKSWAVRQMLLPLLAIWTSWPLGSIWLATIAMHGGLKTCTAKWWRQTLSQTEIFSIRRIVVSSKASIFSHESEAADDVADRQAGMVVVMVEFVIKWLPMGGPPRVGRGKAAVRSRECNMALLS